MPDTVPVERGEARPPQLVDLPKLVTNDASEVVRRAWQRFEEEGVFATSRSVAKATMLAMPPGTDVDALIRKLPQWIGNFSTSGDTPVSICLLGAAACLGERSVVALDNYWRAFTLARHRFVSAGENVEAKLSSSDLGGSGLDGTLGMTMIEIRQTFGFLQSEQLLSGGWATDDGRWEYQIADRINRYRDIETLDEYLGIRATEEVPQPEPEGVMGPSIGAAEYHHVAYNSTMANARANAFLMMPFGKSFEWLRKLIVRAGADIGVRVELADEIFQPGIVIEQIKQRIQAADAVIAVCTGQNPNVFFELGTADQWHWPILLAEDAHDLPFDVQHYRAVIYKEKHEALLVAEIKANIEATLKSVKKGRPDLAPAEQPPRSEPRVLKQRMMQVHVWGLEHEGSLEHFPNDIVYLVQDIASAIQQSGRAQAYDFPKRQSVMTNPADIPEAAQRYGLIRRNYDPSTNDWHLVLTDKGRAFLRAFDRFAQENAARPKSSDGVR